MKLKISAIFAAFLFITVLIFAVVQRGRYQLLTTGNEGLFLAKIDTFTGKTYLFMPMRLAGLHEDDGWVRIPEEIKIDLSKSKPLSPDMAP